MEPYIYDVNAYVQDDADLQTLMGGEFIIHPLVGYEDTAAPYIVYWWMPGIWTKDMYFVNMDFIRYHIFDNDAERGFKVQQRLIEVLNKGDLIQGNIPSTEARALWSVLLRSGTGAFNAGLGTPQEKEGWYELQLNFEIAYVPINEMIVSMEQAGETNSPI